MSEKLILVWRVASKRPFMRVLSRVGEESVAFCHVLKNTDEFGRVEDMYHVFSLSSYLNGLEFKRLQEGKLQIAALIRDAFLGVEVEIRDEGRAES